MSVHGPASRECGRTPARSGCAPARGRTSRAARRAAKPLPCSRRPRSVLSTARLGRPPEARQRIRDHPGDDVGGIVLREHLELTGIQPDASAVGTCLDRDPVHLTARQVIAILGALHVVRLPLRFGAGGAGALSLLPQQLGVFLGEVLVFVAARFLRLHGCTPELELCSYAGTREVKNPLPPVRPSSRSEARSGWGMIPTTFPSGLQIPPM